MIYKPFHHGDQKSAHKVQIYLYYYICEDILFIYIYI